MKNLTVNVEEFVAELKSETHAGKQVMVDFWAAWCGPCRVIGPILEEVEKENPDVVLLKVNVDENPEISGALGIQSIPTLMFFQDGEMNKSPIIGVVPKPHLINHLK